MSLLPSSGLEEARRDFLNETRDMLDDMEHHLGALADVSEESWRSALEAIARTTHSLKGSAGMFGYPAVSSFCHELEELVVLLRKAHSPPDHQDRALLSKVLLGLRGIFGPVVGGEGEDPLTAPTLAELSCALGRRLSDDAQPGRGTPARQGMQDSGADRGDPRAVGGTTPYLRVDPRELAALTRMAGELHLRGGQMLRMVQDPPEESSLLARDLERSLLAHRHCTMELRGRLLSMRMVPLRTLLARFGTVVESLAAEAGKEAQLELTGEETRVDRSILEALGEPILHLVRNSIDHGIELPEERLRSAKSRRGSIAIRAHAEGHHVVIEVTDDGRGIDQGAVKRESARRTSDPSRTDEDVLRTVFTPGFSTRRSATQLSGRGLGLDIVRRRMLALEGMVEMKSTPGEGTRISLRVPQTLTITRGLVVRQGEFLLAFPLRSVTEVQKTDGMVQPEDDKTVLVDLADFFRLPPDTTGGARFLLRTGLADRTVLVLVDEILGQEELALSQLSPLLRGLPGIAGVSELPSGDLSYVVDLPSLTGCSRMSEGPDQEEKVAPSCTLGGKALVLMIGGRRGWVPLEEIHEILPPARFYPVPLARSWLPGVSLKDDRVIPLLDLKSFLGETPAPATVEAESQRIIVSRMWGGCGLLVDDVLGVSQDWLDEEGSGSSRSTEKGLGRLNCHGYKVAPVDLAPLLERGLWCDPGGSELKGIHCPADGEREG